jgi:hypothetical protein
MTNHVRAAYRDLFGGALDAETFVEQVRRRSPQDRDLSEVPRADRRAAAMLPLLVYP